MEASDVFLTVTALDEALNLLLLYMKYFNMAQDTVLNIIPAL